MIEAEPDNRPEHRDRELASVLGCLALLCLALFLGLLVAGTVVIGLAA